MLRPCPGRSATIRPSSAHARESPWRQRLRRRKSGTGPFDPGRLEGLSWAAVVVRSRAACEKNDGRIRGPSRRPALPFERGQGTSVGLGHLAFGLRWTPSPTLARTSRLAGLIALAQKTARPTSVDVIQQAHRPQCRGWWRRDISSSTCQAKSMPMARVATTSISFLSSHLIRTPLGV